MSSVHPTVVIDLAQYDREGIVVLSEPTMARLDTFNALIVERFLTDEEREEFNELPTRKRDDYLRPIIGKHMKSYQIMSLMTYVEKAPWNTYDEYLEYATPRISVAIAEGVDELKSMNPFVLMDKYHEYEMGVELFKSCIREGTNNPYIAHYITYAQFLQHHSKDDWMQMTSTDIMLFSIYHSVYDDENNDRLSMKIANNVSKAFGGKEN